MKSLFYSVFVTLLFSISAFAQTEGISFQGLARNAAGEVLVSQKISLRLSILLDSETGTVAYAETRQVTTNPQGIFSLVVGDDKALTKSTNFSAINWTPAPKFIKVEMDPNGGTSFVAMGTSRLQAVPFAFHAYGVDAANVKGVLPVASGGTGVASISELKTTLGLDQVNNSALDSKVDKEAGKGLSTNDYTTAEKTKLAAITGSNTGDQDLSSYATIAMVNAIDVTSSLASGLATKVDKVSGKALSTNDYTTAEKTKLAAITGTNTGDQVNITGNAGTATKLQTARTINGIAFDGSSDITLPTPASGIPYTGATQAVDLGAFNLKVNGITIGRGKNLATDSNLGVGRDMLNSVTSGSYNTAIGADALRELTTGYNNLAIGANSQRRNIGGIANTAIGVNALQENQYGLWNVAIGNHALRYNTASDNAAIGSGALEFNTTGIFNTAFGKDALKNNSVGSNNTSVGLGALSNSVSNNNTAMGTNSLKNTTGYSNTSLGYAAGEINTTGNENTAIGATATFGANNLSNATAIGFGATTSASNTIQLGNSAVTNVLTSGSITAGKDLNVNGMTIGKGAGNVSNNVAIGVDVLPGSGGSNTAIGNNALNKNGSGGNNVAIGAASLFNNTTGTGNTATGFQALWKNTTGSNNTANGREALKEFVGSNNTAIGYRALWGSSGASTGTSNTAVGSGAGTAITTGSNNIAIGGGDNVDTGSNNILIGVYAKVSTSSFSDATVIGYNASASGSNATAIGNGAVAAANTIQLGNSSVSVIGGQVAWTAASDSRIKKNIVNSTYGLATVLKLRPVEYNLISNDLKQVGFIAQEVQKLVPEVVTGKEGDLSKGEILGITYSNLVPVLTKAIQEQQKQIEDQNAKIAAQQKQIEELIKLVKGQ